MHLYLFQMSEIRCPNLCLLCHCPLTAPCLPTNVRTAAECHADMLITTWDSAAGALSYTVEAQGNTGETYNCSSSSNSCAVTGVPCGEHLSVWITASSDKCTTNKVLGEVAQTGMQNLIKSLQHVGFKCFLPDAASMQYKARLCVRDAYKCAYNILCIFHFILTWGYLVVFFQLHSLEFRKNT